MGTHAGSKWQSGPGLRTLPRRSGLTDTDIARAQRAMPALGAGWSLVRHEDYDRDACVMIIRTRDQEDVPSFTLHAEAGEILAGVVTRDRYVRLGLHHRVEEAMGMIAATLHDKYAVAA
jgi:hypothetical protein